MLSVCEITDIFYLCDEFSTEFNKILPSCLLKEDSEKKHRNKSNQISDSEIMTILISFHLSQFRNLKAYYLGYVCKHLNKVFPKLVSYNRFVELEQKVLFSLVIFLKTCRMVECTGISFVDSTTLGICRIQREHSNAVFDEIAAKGKSTMGWFLDCYELDEKKTGV